MAKPFAWVSLDPSRSPRDMASLINEVLYGHNGPVVAHEVYSSFHNTAGIVFANGKIDNTVAQAYFERVLNVENCYCGSYDPKNNICKQCDRTQERNRVYTLDSSPWLPQDCFTEDIADIEYGIDLPAPTEVVYTFTNTQLAALFSKYIKEQTGIKVEVIVDYDEETYSLTVQLSEAMEERLTEEELDKLFGPGAPMCHPDEWYENAESLLCGVFGIREPIFLVAYALEKEKPWHEGFIVEVKVPFAHYKDQLCLQEVDDAGIKKAQETHEEKTAD